MYIHSVLSASLRVLLPLAFCLTSYLYVYPILHGCAFPSTNNSLFTSFHDTFTQHGWLDKSTSSDSTLAPFRLLVLADPQLEGDSSLPKDGLTARLQSHWKDIRSTGTFSLEVIGVAAQEILVKDIPETLRAVRKRIDLFGNDFYLAHIFRSLHWWTKPSHVTVLGDLIGSQWVSDDEFEWRGWRYWNRVMKGGSRVEDEITNAHENENSEKMWNLTDKIWETRVINIAGNHDIGYAGDISRHRMERFERVFGKANWDIRFQYPTSQNEGESSVTPTLHIIVLNTLNLDQPALAEDVQTESYEFINHVIRSRSAPVEDSSSFTLLLTHVPLHKGEGVCVDSPYFDFWDESDEDEGRRPGGIKEQNHISDFASQEGILGGIFGISGDTDAPSRGRGRSGLILTGHDHEGCDVWHYLSRTSVSPDQSEDNVPEQGRLKWDATRWKDANLETEPVGLREVTLRSMMGDFAGNAGLLSAWFDFKENQWRYDIIMCKVGVQHIWWAIHILDLVTLVLLLSWSLSGLVNFDKVDGKKIGMESFPKKLRKQD